METFVNISRAVRNHYLPFPHVQIKKRYRERVIEALGVIINGF